MLGTNIFLLAGLVASAAASPLVQRQGAPTTTSPAEACPTVCIDAVKTCPDGSKIPYGGCFAHCPKEPFPSPPQPTCPDTVGKREDACPTVCIDAVKTCPDGSKIPYGGCFAHCPNEPFPSPSQPACPDTIEKRQAIPATATTAAYNPCGTTICIDGLKGCANGYTIPYGSCQSYCPGDVVPVLTAPACPSAASSPAKSQPAASTTTVTPAVSQETICVDVVKTCPNGSEIPYGGCYPFNPELPIPIPSAPACPKTTANPPPPEKRQVVLTTSTVTSGPQQTICIDAIETCANGSKIPYGGCYTYASGEPAPTPVAPVCPA